MTPDHIRLPADEEQTRRKLHFALGKRAKSTVALVECASLSKRDEVANELTQSLPEYQHCTLDVTPYPVVSLLRILNEHLPAVISQSQPVEWVVHVYGLENSQLVVQNGRLVPSPMLAQLNLERELLFRQVPYIIVLWGDAGFFRTLQREAPDFWHWVTYKFRFEDDTARPLAALPPLPLERLSAPGNVAERQTRITELKERYEHLALDDSDQGRLLIDKINILLLLGDEYAEAFQYTDAEQAYLAVSGIQERLDANSNRRGMLCSRLGDVYLNSGRLREALASYERGLMFADDKNKGRLFRRIGQVYAEQENWTLALDYHQQALQEQISTENTTQLGDTYYSLGGLYQRQEQWTLALENYQNALDWFRRFNYESGIAATYHHIGMVYQHQQRWASAHENYQQSLERWLHIGNNFYEAATCFQIGQAYYHQLLDEIPKSWHELIAGQAHWCKLNAEVVSWYNKSLAIALKYGHPNIVLVEKGLADAQKFQSILDKVPSKASPKVLTIKRGKRRGIGRKR